RCRVAQQRSVGIACAEPSTAPLSRNRRTLSSPAARLCGASGAVIGSARSHRWIRKLSASRPDDRSLIPSFEGPQQFCANRIETERLELHALLGLARGLHHPTSDTSCNSSSGVTISGG